MRGKLAAALLFTLFLSQKSACDDQSLGDVARQQRLTQQTKKDQPAPKVITNDDLTSQAADDSPSGPSQHEPIPQLKNEKSAAQWQAQIAAQERVIADLQNRMQRLNSSVHFAYDSSYYGAEQYNMHQQKKLDLVQQMQQQLDEQKQKLAELQEAARKDGYGNAVWEP